MEITIEFLKSLNKDIKSKDIWKRERAFSILKAMNLVGYNPGLIMYREYLLGKYHYITSSERATLEHLHNAQQHYKAVFTTADQSGVRVKNPKYHFKYAECTYRLSEAVWCTYRREELKELARELTANALELFPEDNDSLNWLHNELND